MGTKAVWLLTICLLGDCDSIETHFNSEVECAHFAGINTAIILAENLDEKTKKTLLKKPKVVLGGHIIRGLMNDISYTCVQSKSGT